ncbi:MAG TPA: SgcJ/EcaC family oxidoreductase, partial [Holophagaceae bacterium]|nr:SgcJ/EcaC family oxidoreductase [Holophagaceae bacterium]
TAWIEAVNAGDLDTLLDLMAEDALFLAPGQGPVDQAGFPAGFRAAHQASRIRCVSELREVTVVGELAYALSEDALTVAPRSGGPALELKGHRLTLYRKHPDGRWRLVRDAHTLVPVGT